ncbi:MULTISPECIES: hypothetical protein [Vibrio]|uniref:hypothetical protein n=1 Tax=Vibrio TaxID=662 RepID=UPI000575E74B|nr:MULTISPECIES: hypothetical protein [Vibrio]CAE6946724.1 hypothetical protein ACOMICROBIO_GDFFDHBD_03379 [Vibrio sp. B1REV9]
MKNIDLFNLGVASVFGKCYESFPVPIELYSGIIALEVERKHTENPFANIDGHGEQQHIAECTIQWLLDTGYIKGVKKEGFAVFQNVVLTPMGLAALNRMPSSLSGNTIGDQLADFSGECSKSVVMDLVKDVIAEGIRLIAG